jgi:acyl-CoA reductase-like NAD-dependent aldehyde dehydrogenase
MKITTEEIFGPVHAVIKVIDYDEAIRVANDVEYGLSSAIYTNNLRLAHRAVDDLEAGIVYINAPNIIPITMGGK